jgi:hypothetical protein
VLLLLAADITAGKDMQVPGSVAVLTFDKISPKRCIMQACSASDLSLHPISSEFRIYPKNHQAISLSTFETSNPLPYQNIQALRYVKPVILRQPNLWFLVSTWVLHAELNFLLSAG